MQDNQLDRISIASPCTADWNQMTGDDRRRFCSQCSLHVHNLSGMTRDEATALLQQAAGGRMCVRFFRRADGTVLTRDCPVGWRRRMRLAAARTAALCVAMWSSAVACFRPGSATSSATSAPVPGPAHLQGEVECPKPLMGDMITGKVAPSAPATQDPAIAPTGK